MKKHKTTIGKSISHRQSTEEALQKSELRYRGLVNSLDVGVIVHAVDTSIIMSNPKASELLGLTEDQLKGRQAIDPYWKFYSTDCQPLMIELYPVNQVLSSRKAFKDFELGLKRTAESDFSWFSVNGLPVFSSTGEINEIVISFIEITERKKAETALMQSNELLSKFIKYSPVYTFIKQVSPSESRVIAASDNFIDMVGISADEMVGKTMEELFPPDFAVVITADDWKVASEGKVIQLNEQINGQSFSTIKFPLSHDGRNIVAGYTIDITEQLKSEAVLRESEAKYRLLAENASDVIWVANITKEKFTYISPAVFQLRGYTVQEAMQQGLSESLTKESYELVGKTIQDSIAAFTNDPAGTYQNVMEVQQYHKNGDLVWVEISAKLTRNLEGEIEVVGLSRNIQKRKKFEAELRKVEAEQRYLIAEKEKFFSIIAHDLRSPFNVFLGYTQILEDELPTLTLDELQKIAANIRKSAGKLFHLLENLLEWSKMQRGLRNLNLETFPVSTEVYEIVELARDTADRKMIRIIRNISDDLILNADKHMFRSLIRNLVYNAIKYTPREGKIIISAKQTYDKSVLISVADSGIGIEEEMMNKLFVLDSRTNRNGTEGEPTTGLGLIICKDFVDKHGGKIWVESKPGEGSVFSFTLPVNGNMKERKNSK